MKKFLLSIFAVMTAAGFAGAETVELNVADAADFKGTEVPERPAGTNSDSDKGEAGKWQPLQSCKIGDYAFAFSTTSENASQQPAYYAIMSTATSGTPTLRLYSGSTMTITAPEGVNVTKVEFTGSNAGKNLAVTATPGSFALDGNNGTWTGSANSFSLTVSATWRVSKLVITTGEGGETPVDPDPTPGDESTKENPYTVAQAIALGSDYKKAVWVKGFIVGYVNGQAYTEGCVFGNTAAEGAEVSKTNILIAGSNDETDVNNCMPVQLPAGAVRDALNLNANPANLGKELTINAYLTKYFAVPGLKKEGDATYEYVLNGEGSEPIDPPVVETAKFVKAAAIESGKKYLLVADGKAATGKVKDDKAYGYLLVDAVAIDGDVATAPAAYAFTITAVEGAYTIQRPDGTYVAMKGTFNSFNFYASPEEWYEWVISINNDGTADIWNSDADKYVAYDAAFSSYGCYPEDKAETCIKPTLYVLDEGQSGVAEIVIDENAPVEYFNIQGVKIDVENAAPGLYIRRQGNVATKVIVK